MKKLLLSLLLLTWFGTAITAQGMVFEKNTTWQKVLDKAKAENKLVFVDCYTTWCGPCKWLDANTFPDAAVGAFFNKNFVNLKVQMDTTKNDTEYTREWWAIGQDWHKKYGVYAYPSFLVFDAEGTIIDRGVGALPADKFIEKGKELIDPSKQYYVIKRRYEAGDKSEATLRALAIGASKSYDKLFSPIISNEYLATQSDLLTKDNIQLIMEANPAVGTEYFSLVMDNKAKINEVLGSPSAAETFIYRAAYRSKMAKFIGVAKDKTPDWAAMQDTLNVYFPKEADQYVLRGKIQRASMLKDWLEFSTQISAFMTKYASEFSPNEYNSHAWAIFENCDDMKCIERALDWMQYANKKDENNTAMMDTYANLLHKAGKTQDAIAMQTKAIAIMKEANQPTEEYEATLEKMKKGEKTWE